MKNFTKKALAAIMLITIALSACSQEPRQEAEPPPIAEPPPAAELQPEEYPQPVSGSFPFAFTAEDLHGNTITEAGLGEKQLFFVYFWTTWCPACVNSMPGLVELAGEFADYIGVITLLDDFDTARETAIRITEDAPFYTVNARDDDFRQLVQLIKPQVIPTSIIVDAYGSVIGGHIIGGGIDRFRAAIEYALGR